MKRHVLLLTVVLTMAGLVTADQAFGVEKVTLKQAADRSVVVTTPVYTAAYPQGIEAMYQLSPANYKRISRDVGGHQYSKGFQKLQKELASHLGLNKAAQADKKILKEH